MLYVLLIPEKTYFKVHQNASQLQPEQNAPPSDFRVIFAAVKPHWVYMFFREEGEVVEVQGNRKGKSLQCFLELILRIQRLLTYIWRARTVVVGTKLH